MKPRHAAALALVGWYLIAPWTSAENAWEGIMGPSIFALTMGVKATSLGYEIAAGRFIAAQPFA
jgi:hypothetical protein